MFRLSDLLLARRLHILCYHGFQLQDECSFRPKLFISPELFAARLRYIQARGFKALPLGEALVRLRAGTLPARALAITIDDGFKSTLSVAAPLLRAHDMPATVYVTTYYMEKRVPVFRLAVQYLFWRAAHTGLKRPQLAALIGASPQSVTSLSTDDLTWKLIRYGEALSAEQSRQALLTSLADVLGVDLVPLREKHLLSLLSPADVSSLAQQDFDIQLHTHRHRFPIDDRQSACREIEENRSRLEALTGRAARHLCYPSGIFASSQWPWLEETGIDSATTCLPGFNSAQTPRYGLRRFLDSEDIRFIEFRAELAGFNHLLRTLRARVPGLGKPSDASNSASATGS